jgi:uncharacterized protein (DUF1330 family)
LTAYIIADVDVRDPVAYEEYRQQVPATLEKYGGRFVVRGGKVDVLEGAWRPGRIVVLAFDSVEKAKAWWSSVEYAGPKALRQSASKGSLIVVPGWEG